MSKDLPKFSIDGNSKKHGPHADGLAETSFGSDQVRVGPDGKIIDGQLNFSGRLDDGLPRTKFAWERFDDRFNIDRNGVLGDRLMGNGLPDPRGTAMGGYNR